MGFFCGLSYFKRVSLDTHQARNHSRVSKCLICNDFLAHRETAKDHLQKFHNYKKPATCTCCDWTFAGITESSYHRKFLTQRNWINNIYPLVVIKCPPGFRLKPTDRVCTESKAQLTSWHEENMKNWVQSPSSALPSLPNFSTSPVFNATGTPKAKKSFMIRDLIDLDDRV